MLLRPHPFTHSPVSATRTLTPVSCALTFISPTVTPVAPTLTPISCAVIPISRPTSLMPSRHIPCLFHILITTRPIIHTLTTLLIPSCSPITARLIRTLATPLIHPRTLPNPITLPLPAPSHSPTPSDPLQRPHRHRRCRQGVALPQSRIQVPRTLQGAAQGHRALPARHARHPIHRPAVQGPAAGPRPGVAVGVAIATLLHCAGPLGARGHVGCGSDGALPGPGGPGSEQLHGLLPGVGVGCVGGVGGVGGRG